MKFLALILSLFLSPVLYAHTVTLNWTASVTPGVTYQIFRATTSGAESFIGSSSSVSYQDQSVQPGTTYFYYVESTDSFGNSSPSNEISVVVPVAPATGLTVTSSN